MYRRRNPSVLWLAARGLGAHDDGAALPPSAIPPGAGVACCCAASADDGVRAATPADRDQAVETITQAFAVSPEMNYFFKE